MSKRPKDERLNATVDANLTAFSVGASVKLTTTYAKDVAAAWDRDPRVAAATGWVDTRINDNGTNIFDLVRLLAIPAIGSGLKIRMRISLSNDAGSNEEYYRVGGRIWEQDFDANANGVRVDLPAFGFHHRYFAIEAKYIGGSDTGTGLFVSVALLHANTSDGRAITVVEDRRPVVEIIRSYAILPASGAWSANADVDIMGARFLELLIYYVEGSGSSGGNAEVETDLMRLVGAAYQGCPTCMVKRSVVPVAGGNVTTQVRPEKYEMQGENLEYNLTGGAWTGGTATATIGAHAVRVGDYITVRGTTPSGYNEDFALVTAVAATTVSYAVTSDPGAWSSGGILWQCQARRLEFNGISKYDLLRVRAKETGDTTNKGDMYMVVTRFMA